MTTERISTTPERIFKPQPGPQTRFLSARADIVGYGGSAGSGKTFAEMLESLRHHGKRNARIAFFRRERVRVTVPGGLWDESHTIYPFFRGASNEARLSWKFPSGATISFLTLQYEQDVKKYHGGQFAVQLWDELTEFLESQFWYMSSRNRTSAKIKPYIRFTCNPDADSWVAKLIAWWIGDDGFPIAARSGVVRWFFRRDDFIYWGDTKQELIDKYEAEEIDCLSFTFIGATIEDNQILLQNNPGYISTLRGLHEIDKQRLLYGNWKIKKEGKIFHQADFKLFTRNPASYLVKIITVDTAQKVKEHNDWSVFQAWVKTEQGIYLIDQFRGKMMFPELKTAAMAFITKHNDARYVFIEDTVSGTSLIQTLGRELQRQITPIERSKDKYTRAYDCQGYVEAGYVWINCMSDYYTDFISEIVSFAPENANKSEYHDDQVDCMMDGIDQLLINCVPYYKSAAEERSISSTIY